MQEGQKALTALELPTAIKKLQQAVEMLSKVLPYIKKAELADAMMALGSAHFENGDKREAKRTFERLLVWRSDYKVDLSKYPPELLAIVEDMRKEVERQKRGSTRDSLRAGGGAGVRRRALHRRDADVRRRAASSASTG